MAESLRSIKNRIRSVESVEKLTNAMKMVATAKLRTLQKNLTAFGEYFSRLENLFRDLLAGCADLNNELFAARPAGGKKLLYIFSSDTGLCGVYNSFIFNMAERFIRQSGADKTSLAIIGRKGFSHFKRRGFRIVNSHLELYSRYSDEVKDRIVRDMTGAFLNREVDEIHAVYANFISPSKHPPVTEKILNLEIPAGKKRDYIAEPEMASIISGLIPLYLSAKIRSILLKSFTAEQAQRIMAMSEATDNAGELLDDLVLTRNKIRQERITTEIIEVISSTSILKG